MTYNESKERKARSKRRWNIIGVCLLPFFTPAGVWGVFVGCLITNLFGGSWIDIVFGSLATLIAAVLTKIICKAIRKKTGNTLDYRHSLLVPIPTVVVNAVIIPFVLYYGYGLTEFLGHDSTLVVLAFYALTVGLGELAVCYVLGVPLMMLVNSINGKTQLF